jgi:small subunit ribosomal protein S16
VAVHLRLRRIGKKKMPLYQIVAADSRAARNGKFLEVVGRYDPLKNPPLIDAKEIRVLHWLRNGAQPTDTVRSLFQRNGLWFKWSLTKSGADEAKVAAEMEKWHFLQAERQKRDDERKSRRKAAKKAKAAPAEAAAPAPAPPAAPPPAQPA